VIEVGSNHRHDKIIFDIGPYTTNVRRTRKPSLEIAPTSLAQRTQHTTKNTARRNVHQ